MKLAQITWNDAYDIGGWTSLEELSSSATGTIAETVGWVIEDSEKRIILVQTVVPADFDPDNPDEECLRNAMVIPKETIIKVETLKE